MHTLPGYYADGQEEQPRAEPLTDVELREHFPAASSSQDTYTLLKFYNLSKDLVRTVLQVCAASHACQDHFYFLVHTAPSICIVLHAPMQTRHPRPISTLPPPSKLSPAVGAKPVSLVC